MNRAEPAVESLSQRELRNESGRVLRAVAAGESFVLTNSGVPVGRIVPLSEPEPGLSITRPARRSGGWSTLGVTPKRSEHSLAEILDEIRGERL
ncbi:MAG: type II toxin-antitoxin system prevent-host-death family antitoxin [bacterium]|nr:type II toxin-antitoxin system prevent-host-death family antitoxin [bacterium]